MPLGPEPPPAVGVLTLEAPPGAGDGRRDSPGRTSVVLGILLITERPPSRGGKSSEPSLLPARQLWDGAESRREGWGCGAEGGLGPGRGRGRKTEFQAVHFRLRGEMETPRGAGGLPALLCSALAGGVLPPPHSTWPGPGRGASGKGVARPWPRSRAPTPSSPRRLPPPPQFPCEKRVVIVQPGEHSGRLCPHTRTEAPCAADASAPGRAPLFAKCQQLLRAGGWAGSCRDSGSGAHAPRLRGRAAPGLQWAADRDPAWPSRRHTCPW